MPYGAMAGMAIGGLLGGVAQGGISAASAAQQQAAQREAYKNRYQWTLEDMRKAGLNPVLAAQHGAGNVGPMAQMDSSGIASAVQAASQMAVQRSQADLNSATAREATASAEIAEKTRDAMNRNPNLYETRAETQAGINPSSPVGAVRGLAERSGIMSPASSAQAVTEGIYNRFIKKPWKTPNNWRKDVNLDSYYDRKSGKWVKP